MDVVEPPYIVPYNSPDNMMSAPVGFIPNVMGRRRDREAPGPSPGRTPTRVPMRTPERQRNRFMGVRATPKPNATCCQTSISIFLKAQKSSREVRLQPKLKDAVG